MQAIILILASVNILMTISLLFSLMASERRRKGKEDISNDAIARLESYISRGFESLERENDEFRKEVSSYLEKSLNASISSQSDLFSRSEAQTKSMTETVSHMSERLSASLMDLKLASKGEMEAFAKALQSEFEKVRAENDKSSQTLAEQTKTLVTLVRSDMEKIRFDNEKKLEEMRKTVDEKLQSTLENRISKSFEQVTKNLEALYRSIGEMDKLAGDISSLNKMFSNVKVRGTWGEVQAENILSDLMTPSQYVRNYSPKRGGSVVEFAIRLPGRDSDGEVYLPIDSKFPKEDFVRYSEAVSEGDEARIQQALKDLRARVLAEARDIRDKYIVPPKTTDFAILFVPTESLYAELLRIDGFAETLQDDYRVLLTGPTNFAALINSLQIGFKTLQVEKNTKRIWQLFKDLKTQFFRFGEDLEKTQSAIDRASDRISDAVKRNSMITGKLERIELPEDIEKGPQLDASYSDSTALVE